MHVILFTNEPEIVVLNFNTKSISPLQNCHLKISLIYLLATRKNQERFGQKLHCFGPQKNWTLRVHFATWDVRQGIDGPIVFNSLFSSETYCLPFNARSIFFPFLRWWSWSASHPQLFHFYNGGSVQNAIRTWISRLREAVGGKGGWNIRQNRKLPAVTRRAEDPRRGGSHSELSRQVSGVRTGGWKGRFRLFGLNRRVRRRAALIKQRRYFKLRERADKTKHFMCFLVKSKIGRKSLSFPSFIFLLLSFNGALKLCSW